METYKTKKGFGGLLKEGLKCEIAKKDFPVKGKVLIKVLGVRDGQNAIYIGSYEDIEVLIESEVPDFTNQIKNVKNIVEAESIILTEVSNKYFNLFSQTERKFNRAGESQASWIADVWKKYRVQSKRERLQLFSNIPERFHKKQMYINLEKRLKTRSY